MPASQGYPRHDHRTLTAAHNRAAEARFWIETGIMAELERREFRGQPFDWTELRDMLEAIALDLP